MPMSSMATTTVFLPGLAGVVFGLSVLSIGGGGFAVQLASTVVEAAMMISIARRIAPVLTCRTLLGLAALQRSPVSSLPSRKFAPTFGGTEDDLAHPHDLRCDLDAFIGGTELHRRLQVELQRLGERLHHIGGRAAHIR